MNIDQVLMLKRAMLTDVDKRIASVGDASTSTGSHLLYDAHFLGEALNPHPFPDWSELGFIQSQNL
ncbi:MAG: hypothetical protein AB1717_01245 [Pseudomonadota bacterium]